MSRSSTPVGGDEGAVDHVGEEQPAVEGGRVEIGGGATGCAAASRRRRRRARGDLEEEEEKEIMSAVLAADRLH
jgi:hypothetical protein